jgi:hypothetical protein
MIGLPANFETAIAAGEINKLIFVKLYYDDGSNYISFASKSLVVDDVQSIGAVVTYSPSKSTWNIMANNNVTITVPTLKIANIQMLPDYKFINELVSKNFSGRQCQVFIGFDAYSTTEDDMTRIFDGEIFDFEFDFNSNDIDVTLRAQNIPVNEIQGKLISYETDAIGDIATDSLTSIVQSIDNKYVPIPFGTNQFSPGVIIGSNESSSSDLWTYAFADRDTVSGSSTSSVFYNVPSAKAWHDGGSNQQRLYWTDNGFYVPCMKKSWSYNWNYPASTRWSWSTSIVDNNYIVEFAPPLSGDSEALTADAFFNIIPWHHKYDENTTEYASPNMQTSGDMANVWDGDVATFITLTADSGTENNLLSFNYYLGTEFNLNFRSEEHDNGYVYYRDKPIHVNNNEDDIPAAVWEQFDAGAPNRVEHCIRAVVRYANFEAGVGQMPVGFNPYDDDTINAGDYNAQFDFSTLGSYGNGVGWYSWPFAGSKDGEFTVGNSNGLDSSDIDVTDINSDGSLISRNSAETSNIRYEYWAAENQILNAILYNINMAYRGNQYFEEDNLNLTINGPIGVELKSLTSAASLYRPYHYLETIIRYAASATDTNFSDNWTASAIDEKWESMFNTARDNSGFTITEKMKLNDFVKTYVKNEPFTIYRNELNEYDILCLKKEYEVGDVQYVVDFNDCTAFNIKNTNIQNIYWKIDELKTDYNIGLKSYTNTNIYQIDDGTYDSGFYGDSSELILEKVEKKYTSQSEAIGVQHNSAYWYIKDAHLSNSLSWTSPISAGLYVEADEAHDEWADWTIDTQYIQNGSESNAIAKFNLNQHANRHKVVSWEAKDYTQFKLQLGDIVRFDNVPYTCLGLPLYGWDGNGAIQFDVTVNGQKTYAAFIITAITKGLESIKIEATQLVHLNSFNITGIGTPKNIRPNYVVPSQ